MLAGASEKPAPMTTCSSEYEPALHALHDEALAAELVPSGHEEQLEAPGAAKVPAEQTWHVRAAGTGAGRAASGTQQPAMSPQEPWPQQRDTLPGPQSQKVPLVLAHVPQPHASQGALY